LLSLSGETITILNLTKMKFSFKLSLLIAVPLTMMIGCSDDGDLFDCTPAVEIIKSEKLEIPDAVDLPSDHASGHTRVATYFAKGVQKYKAQPKTGVPGEFEWVLVAPVAVLFDKTNRSAGTHTAGPTWQLTGGMDSIYAQQFVPPRSAPSPDPNSIPWLLLKPKDGKIPTGIFADVDYIQRIATKGGKAPATLPQSINDTVNVAYTAVYRFSKMNP
jgi:hypothetical protein